MFNKSIAYRLSIYISLAVVAVFIVFIIIIGIFNSKIVNENIEITAINESSQIIMIVEKQLISTKEISLNISEQILYYANNNDVDLFLGKLMEKYTYINAIHVNIDTAVPNILFHNYFTFRSKDSLIIENRNTEIYHCENERYNFKRFTEEKVSGWSSVFSCERNKNLVVSFYAPIQINEKNGDTTIVGSVISELSLSTLNDSINKSKIRPICFNN